MSLRRPKSTFLAFLLVLALISHLAGARDFGGLPPAPDSSETAEQPTPESPPNKPLTADELARQQALDAYLQTLPNVTLADRTSLFHFTDAGFDLDTMSKHGTPEGVPSKLIAQVFQSPDDESVPAGLRNVKSLLRLPSAEAREPLDTFVLISPIALDTQKREAVFGSFEVGAEGLTENLVYMRREAQDWTIVRRVVMYELAHPK